jgi:hypothetical protein
MAKNPFVAPPVGSLTEAIRSKFTEHKVIHPPTKDTYFRGSGFASICPREEVLAAVHKIVREEAFEANSLVNFALGTGIHLALQEVILPAIGAILGEWSCLGCGLHAGGGTPFEIAKMVPRPSKCEGCGSTQFRYVEQFFKDDTYRITGHPDGFLRVPDREGIGLLEAKSIGQRGAWEVKKVPKFEHMIQAQIYMWFTGLTWACVLYWDKGVYGMDSFIEHFIERDEDTIEAVQTDLLLIRNGIETGELPDPICANADAPRAKTCACAKPCFLLEK